MNRDMGDPEAEPDVEPPRAWRPPAHARIRAGMRRQHNWVQLVKFAVVGASGYVVNLAVFTVAVEAGHLHHIPAAVIAFLVAVSNNFAWNRYWTFHAGGGRAGFQAPRFFAVSIGAFLVALSVLELLVSVLGVPPVAAQATSIVVATPINFVGNKMWSFATSESS
jgi:putative flippase GtrA